MTEDQAERHLGQALRNGLRCRCPRCGQGKLYRRYLKLVDRCDSCGLDLSAARADDLPAYIAITIVGHILVLGLLHFQSDSGFIEPWVYLLGMCVAAVGLPLLLLPSIKGAVVAMQWSQRMHGF
jgi:uncharacterized protein (DUF983 family)